MSSFCQRRSFGRSSCGKLFFLVGFCSMQGKFTWEDTEFLVLSKLCFFQFVWWFLLYAFSDIVPWALEEYALLIYGNLSPSDFHFLNFSKRNIVHYSGAGPYFLLSLQSSSSSRLIGAPARHRAFTIFFFYMSVINTSYQMFLSHVPSILDANEF